MLTACSLLTGPNDLDNLESARSRWKEQGLQDYTYDLRWDCFCGAPAGRWIRVYVVRDAVVEATYIDNGEDVELRYVRDLPTIPDLFDRVADILEDEPDDFDVIYHRDDGHPILLLVDMIENAVDDEYSFQSRNLQVLELLAPAGGR